VSLIHATICRESGHAPTCAGTVEKRVFGQPQRDVCACPCHARWLRRQWLKSAWRHRYHATLLRQALTTARDDGTRAHLGNQIALQDDAKRRALYCAKNVRPIYNLPA